jgi:transposase
LVAEEKERLVAATLEPDAVVSEVARREGVHSSQLFRWRRQLCRPLTALPDFAAVTVVPEPGRIRHRCRHRPV